MPLDPALAGKSYPPSPPYLVTREKIREFADAVDDPNPVYRDPAAAAALGHRDVPAPPTFPVVVTFAGTQGLLDDPALGLALHRLLHGDQRFTYVRPILAGDRLVTVTTIDTIKQAAGMDVVSTSTVVRTVDGEDVCTGYGTLFHKPEETA